MNSYGGDYHLLLPVAGLLIAGYITRRIIPIIIYVVKHKKWLDMPDDGRKNHAEPVPALGGVAIFVSLLITFAIMALLLDNWTVYPFLAGALCLLFFAGLKDDLLVINPKKKIMIQILAPALVVAGGGVYIESFSGLFGIQTLPVWLAVSFTIFVYVVIINAYNLIDGIDGLAGGIGVIIALVSGGWFLTAGMLPQAVLAFCLAGSLLGFIRFNWQPASIFMGDTGSMVTGFVLAFLIVEMLQTGMTATTAPFHHIIPLFAMALLAVPLYDTLRVFILRIARGQSPFTAGRDHIHHALLAMSGSHGRASAYLYLANIAVLMFVIAFAALPAGLLFGLTLILCLVIFPTVGIKRRLLGKIGAGLFKPEPTNGMLRNIIGAEASRVTMPQMEIRFDRGYSEVETGADNGSDNNTVEVQESPVASETGETVSDVK